jgi:hypothetical protein
MEDLKTSYGKPQKCKLTKPLKLFDVESELSFGQYATRKGGEGGYHGSVVA